MVIEADAVGVGAAAVTTEDRAKPGSDAGAVGETIDASRGTGTDPITLVVTAAVALLVGFVVGWITLARFSRRRSTFPAAEERRTPIGV